MDKRIEIRTTEHHERLTCHCRECSSLQGRTNAAHGVLYGRTLRSRDMTTLVLCQCAVVLTHGVALVEHVVAREELVALPPLLQKLGVDGADDTHHPRQQGGQRIVLEEDLRQGGNMSGRGESEGERGREGEGEREGEWEGEREQTEGAREELSTPCVEKHGTILCDVQYYCNTVLVYCTKGRRLEA